MRFYDKKWFRPVLFLVFFLLFLLSRIWVLQHPPKNYSDVKHDYERYANMWRYGLTPYREHLYEYPPATVPLLALPLEIDQRGVGKFYLNYRVQIFVFETIFFCFLLSVLYSRKTLVPSSIAVLFYVICGMVAKDFWYEGLDTLFFDIVTLLIIWLVRFDQSKLKHRVVVWALFSLSVGVKLITFPLAVPLFLMTKLSWKKEIVAGVMGFLLIWAAPLALYRSSLSVFLIFHMNRPMKYGAFGTYIVEFTNLFTKSDERLFVGPDFPMVGPVTDVVTSIIKIVFPIAIGAVIGWFCLILWRNIFSKKKIVHAGLFHAMVLVYVFVFFLTSKTFSSPFHLWYVPLFALYEFSSKKKQLMVYMLALLMLLLDTTNLLKAPNMMVIPPVDLPSIRNAFRFIPMFILLVMFARDILKRKVIYAKK